MSSHKEQQIRDRVQRIAPELKSLGEQSGVPVDAIRKVEQDADLRPEEVDALEAIVLAHARPALPVRNNTFSDAPPLWAHLDDFRENLNKAIAATCRIETPSDTLLPYAGTAFLVAPNIVMTARHVAEQFTRSTTPDVVMLRAVRVNFGSGSRDESGLSYRVTSVVLIHPFLDVALLRIAGDSALAPLVLSAEDPSQLVDREVAVIAYPFLEGRQLQQDQQLVRGILGNESGTKWLMPGKVIGPKLALGFGTQVLALAHDCMTLTGSSGAPVVDLQTGKVVGISFATRYLEANYAVPASEILRDSHVRGVGVSFDYAAAKTVTQEIGGKSRLISPPPALSNERTYSQLAGFISRHFPSTESFVSFLSTTGYTDVVQAVPAKAPVTEFLLALDRRSAIDGAFLNALAKHTGDGKEIAGFAEQLHIPFEDPASSAAQVEVVLPKELLARVVEDLAQGSVEMMKLIATGSKWRDQLLGEDGKVYPPAETVQRLSQDPSAEAKGALHWLLRRLLDTFPGEKPDDLKALQEAVQIVALEEGPPVASAVRLEPPWMQSIQYLRDGLEAARSVAVVRYPKTEAADEFGSTGWLLTPSLLVIPAHTLAMDNSAATQEELDARVQVLKVTFDFDARDSSTRDASVSAVALISPELDLALLQLAEPVSDRRPLVIRTEVTTASDTVLAMIHHARLGPKQISRGGQILENDGHDVLYRIDSAPGSAGAPLFDGNWRVVATHRASLLFRPTLQDKPVWVKQGTASSALVNLMRDFERVRGNLWTQVLAAQPSLRTVDPSLLMQLEELGPEGTIPVVINMADADAALEDIPGIRVDSRSQHVLTAVATRECIEALMHRPEVLSIEASKGGLIECAVSVPHTGAAHLHGAPHNESGDRALIAVLDSGVDIHHASFLDDAGDTRILAFWDQTDDRAAALSKQTTAAVGHSAVSTALIAELKVPYGALYVREDIQALINGAALPKSYPPAERMAHGTAVCSIAAGRRTGAAVEDFAGGVAPYAKLLVVRCDLQNSSVGYSKGHVDALEFVDRYAAKVALPVVVNISNGMNAGAHDGTSLVEKRCESFTDLGQKPGRIVVKSAGNERGGGHHAAPQIAQGGATELRWISQPPEYRPGGNSPEVFELWFPQANQYQFRVRHPDGAYSGPIGKQFRSLEELLMGNRVLAKLTLYHPENGDSYLHLEISPGDLDTVRSGQWALEIVGTAVPKNAPIHAWVELMYDREVFFLDHLADEYTVTIPGTANSVISVGAIETADYMKAFSKSSWGPARNGREKPEIVAPGVGIFAAGAGLGNGRQHKSGDGTSLAAPHVTGAIALAISAGEKAGLTFNAVQIRAAMIDGARHKSGYWNRETGYGELDAQAFFTNILGV